jgi:hypothetical protein
VDPLKLDPAAQPPDAGSRLDTLVDALRAWWADLELAYAGAGNPRGAATPENLGQWLREEFELHLAQLARTLPETGGLGPL